MILNKILRYLKRPIKIRKLIKEEIGDSNKNIDNKIVLNSVRWLPNSFIMEINLAILLIKKGYTVEIIVDDGLFEHTDTILYNKYKSINYYKAVFLINKLRRKLEYIIWNLCIGKITKKLTFTTTTTINNCIASKNKNHSTYIKESMVRFFQTDLFTISKIHTWYNNITQKNTVISYKIGLYANKEMGKNKNYQ